MEKNNKYSNCKTLDDLIETEYGSIGTPKRDDFEEETQAFILAETLKTERLKAGMTQEQLAEKVGTKKAYISRIENGKCDIQLSTLYRLFEGLGRRVCVTIL